MTDRERWDGWLGPKQWIPIVGVLSLAMIALAVLLVLNIGDDDGGTAPRNTTAGRVPSHEHADFLVVIRGQKFDFNKPEFLSDPEGKELSQNVHLHLPRTTVVHVHTTLTTWDEFFSSLGFKLDDPSFPGVPEDKTCMTLPDKTKLCNTATEKWKFVANGVQVDGMSNVHIGDLDRVLFSYGPETFDQVMKDQWPQVSDQACIPSEVCRERIPANEPPETCSGRGICSR